MTAAKLFRSAAPMLLLCLSLQNPAHAQSTIQLAADADARALFQQAEALLASNNAQGAYDLLQARSARYAGTTYFDYLLGVAALDAGRIDAAIILLRRAAASAGRFSAARMELARALYEAGEYQEARPLFVALLSEEPPPRVRDVLERYLQAIDTRPARPPSRFAPYAELFAGHDSNANGSTDQQQFLGFTLSPENLETSSPFFEAAAGFQWTLPQSTGLAWQLGARAAHRANPDASFVDSGLLGASAGLAWRSDAAYGRAALQAYRSNRDGDANEAYAGVDLALGRSLSERWDLLAGLRHGALRYDGSLDVLDVDRTLYSAGFGYRFHSRGRFGFELIGGADNERQSGSPHGNSKSGARIGVNVPVGPSAYLHLTLGRLRSDYDGLFFGARREDTQDNAMLQLEFRDVLTDGLTLTPRLRHIDNDSDLALYRYRRTEVGLLIRWAPK